MLQTSGTATPSSRPYTRAPHYLSLFPLLNGPPIVSPSLSLHLPSSLAPADIKRCRTILQTIHSSADLDFMVGATKWVLELAGDHGLIATLDEV